MNLPFDSSLILELVDSYPAPIVIVDDELNKILFVNKLFRELFNISPDNELKADEILNNIKSKVDLNKESISTNSFMFSDLNEKIITTSGVSIRVTSNIIHRNFPNIKKYTFEEVSNRDHQLNTNIEIDNIYGILNALPIPVFFKDSQGVYTGFNKAFEKFVGKNKDDIIGKKIFDLVDKKSADFYADMDKKILKNPGEIVREERLKIGVDKIHDIIVHKSTYYNSKGRVEGIAGVIFDISKQKNIQELLKKSEKELVELNANKDKFFSILAHDLKNPFSVILGITSFLIENFSDFTEEEIIESLNRLNSSSRHLFNLFENLLEWSRIQRNAISFLPVRLNLASTSRMSLHPLKIMAMEKKIEIANNIPDDIDIIADEKMIEAIFRNLISNAIKYSNAESVVTLEARRADKKHAEIEIIDNGIGINNEMLDDLFKIDNIKSQPGTNNEKGTGLGLILCKEFINQNGGEISVKSKVNEGSSFKFTMPLAKD